MQDYTIYLVGQISENRKTYEWRQNIKTAFWGKGHLEGNRTDSRVFLIDPCGSEFNETESFNGDSAIVSDGTNLLTPKDRNYVAQSDAAIANFNHYTPEKPFIGTMFELGWYYDSPDKMVIGIYDGDRKTNYITHHPFVRNTVHAWVKDEYEAVAMFKKYMDIR